MTQIRHAVMLGVGSIAVIASGVFYVWYRENQQQREVRALTLQLARSRADEIHASDALLRMAQRQNQQDAVLRRLVQEIDELRTQQEQTNQQLEETTAQLNQLQQRDENEDSDVDKLIEDLENDLKNMK